MCSDKCSVIVRWKHSKEETLREKDHGKYIKLGSQYGRKLLCYVTLCLRILLAFCEHKNG